MKDFNNKGNIQPAQIFNPPTIRLDQDGGICRVYDAAAWGNKNKKSIKPKEEVKSPVAAVKPKASSFGAPRSDMWAGAVPETRSYRA